jgi:patatin-like phospholipase/acyl hydrolase
MTFEQRLSANGQKKMLALDGGGIRGVIALEVLKRIEQILRERADNPSLVLSDYFDYFAGTSTGAIIATCLSTGMTVDAIAKFYHESGPAMFSRAGMLKRFWYKFNDESLAGRLQEVFGANTRLGDAKLRTLLMMVLRNATTDSPWPVSNNPRAKYNDRALPDCNLDLPLWQLVRASTAAPTYFPPEVVSVGNQDFVFVDGGVTMYNNPAFQMFLMATLEPYQLQWKTGLDNMLLISVGTGTSPSPDANLQSGDMNLAYQASSIPSALMYAALNEQDLLCRVFGKTLAGCPLDLEVGDLKNVAGPAPQKLFSYARYNAELSREGLDQLGLRQILPEHVRQMDSVEFIPEMQAVGQKVAELEVKPEHFHGFHADSSERGAGA